jgi:hypothetical protein
MTCNVSEFAGLMLILKWISAQKVKEKVHIISDSRIVINRMSGRSRRPPQGVCALIANDCRKAAFPYRNILSFAWQARDNNEECDAMCQLEIDERVGCLQVACPESVDEEEQPGSEAELILAKQRSGATGIFPLAFNQTTLTFEERETGAYRQAVAS